MIALTDIVKGLKNQLRNVGGLEIVDYVPGDSVFPVAFIVPPDIDYRQTMRMGVTRLELDVVVLVSATVDRLQKDLFPYLDWSGPSSLIAAVEADTTLGLAGIQAVAMSSRPLAGEEIAGYQAYGAAVRFLVTSTTSP